MKVDMVTKIIHYCMIQNDSNTANSFLQSYIAECVRNNKEEETVNPEIVYKGVTTKVKNCWNCKYSGFSALNEPCKSCYNIYPPNKNWESKS